MVNKPININYHNSADDTKLDSDPPIDEIKIAIKCNNCL